MADLGDVLDALALSIAAALYPGGPTDLAGNALASTAGPVVKVMRGTPVAKQMDEDLRLGTVNVTVNERPGIGRTTTRFPMQWQTASVDVASLTVAVAGDTLTVSGTATPGQALLIIVDGRPYSYQSQSGDTPESVTEGLAGLILLDRPAIVLVNVLTIPGANLITARGVVQGTAIRPTRQQEAGLLVKVFAPSFGARDAVAGALDASLSLVPRLMLADGTVAMFRYSGTSYDDRPQKALTYIRTLLYQAEYSTTQTVIETSIGVVEAVLAPGAEGAPPGPIVIVTDTGPPIGPAPSDLSVIMVDGEVSVDMFGNPEVQL